MERRDFLAAATLAGLGGLGACGGGSNTASSGSSARGWTIDPPPILIEGEVAVVFDLQQTLPANTPRGGRFSVSTAGQSLPPGIQLSDTGELSLSAAALAGSYAGIVFSYEEPAR